MRGHGLGNKMIYVSIILRFRSRAPLAGRWPRFGFLLTAFSEFRRAIAAEQRYEELRHKEATALTLEGIARIEVPRCIFEEFYSTDQMP